MQESMRRRGLQIPGAIQTKLYCASIFCLFSAALLR
jgi:hypothetical protein